MKKTDLISPVKHIILDVLILKKKRKEKENIFKMFLTLVCFQVPLQKAFCYPSMNSLGPLTLAFREHYGPFAYYY